MNDTISTHDLLRPTATRATGTRAWVWYVAIGGFALVIIIYLTNIFMTKPATIPPAAATSNTAPALQAGQTFRYSGRVVDNSVAPLRAQNSLQTESANSAAARGATAPVNPPLPTVPPNASTYGTASTATSDTNDVPDVTGARAGYVRIPLPTPAPGQVGTVNAAAPSAHGIAIVYGAAETADSPVPQPTLGGSATNAGRAMQTALTAQAQPTSAAGGLAGSAGEIMPGRRRAPSARYEVAAGTSIPCQTVGYIQSNMPGPVSCKTVSPVIDALSGEVLVPPGSHVLGYYAGLTQDATALNISWTRLMFPDRSSFPLDRLPALNEDGHMGVSGSYDDHRGKLFRSTFIGAILAAVAQRFVGSGSSTTNIYVTTGTGPSGQPYAASAQMILDLVSKLNARDSQAVPTIVIPENTPVEIYVDRDMIFDAPYQPMQASS